MPTDLLTAREASPELRATFVRRTLAHLALAVAALAVCLSVLVPLVSAQVVLGWTKQGPLLSSAVAGLVGGAWLARWWGESEPATWLQYAGLGLHVLLLAAVLLPIVRLAGHLDASALPASTALLASVAAGLALAAWRTKGEYAPLVAGLWVLLPVAAALLLAGVVLGPTAGLLVIGLVAVALVGATLADVSRLVAYHRPDYPVAAALGLSAAGGMLILGGGRLLRYVARCRD